MGKAFVGFLLILVTGLVILGMNISPSPLEEYEGSNFARRARPTPTPAIRFKVWDEGCPYPNQIFAEYKHADQTVRKNLFRLNRAVSALEKSWIGAGGGQLVVLQAYRPAMYQAHLREMWEWYRILDRWNPRDFRDYGCDDHLTISSRQQHLLTAEQAEELRREFALHEFHENSFPVSCNSDHSRGAAVDLSIAGMTKETLNTLVAWAEHHGLKQNIPGDDGHFVLAR